MIMMPGWFTSNGTYNNLSEPHNRAWLSSSYWITGHLYEKYWTEHNRDWYSRMGDIFEQNTSGITRYKDD